MNNEKLENYRGIVTYVRGSEKLLKISSGILFVGSTALLATILNGTFKFESTADCIFALSLPCYTTVMGVLCAHGAKENEKKVEEYQAKIDLMELEAAKAK